MKSPPTKGSWWEQFKEAVSRLPDEKPSAMVYHLPDGVVLNIDKMLEENTRLLEEVQRLRQTLTDTVELRVQLANAKHNESLLARRAETLRRRWPAIHKQFFSTERKDS